MRRPSATSVTCLFLACALSFYAGCKDKAGTSGSHVHQVPKGTTLKLAFITNNASDFWKIAEAGIHKYERESGVHVNILLPSNGLVEQKQMLQNMVNQGYNGIAISVIAPDDETEEVNAAVDQSNVICHDSDAPKSNRLLYIGTNNFEAGKTLGQQIVKLLPNGGTMAVFVGTFSADNARKRLEGIESAIQGHNITIIEKKEDNKDPNKARSNVENVINANPNISLLCGLWSYNGPAIANAVDAAGKKGKIQVAVFDEEQGTLDGIENGIIACTVVQKPFQFGYLSAKWLHDLAYEGEAILPKDRNIDTGVEVIKSDNVADFRAKLSAMKNGH